MARKSGLQDSREAVVKIYTVTKELRSTRQLDNVVLTVSTEVSTTQGL